MLVIRVRQSQRGMASIFFGVLIVPVLLLFLHLGLEVGGMLNSMRALEGRLDRVATSAGRILPDEAGALRVAQAGLRQLREELGSDLDDVETTVQFDADGALRLRVMAVNRPFSLVPGLALPLAVGSVVQRTPIEALVLLDSSDYLAPADVSEVWSQTASTYFGNRLDQPQAQLLTQQCLNPVTKILKRGVLALASWFKAGRSNQVGLGFFPRNSAALEGFLGSPYFSLLGSADAYRDYRGELVSDRDCRQQADLEGYYVAEFGWPEGFSQLAAEQLQLVWGKAAQRRDVMADDTFGVLKDGIRELGVRSLQEEGMHARKLLFLVAGDVPRSQGQRFPFDVSLTEFFESEVAELLEPGGSLEIVYLVFQDEVLAQRLPNTEERLQDLADQIRAQAQVLGPAAASRFKFNFTYHTDAARFSHDLGLLMSQVGGSVVVRRGL